MNINLILFINLRCYFLGICLCDGHILHGKTIVGIIQYFLVFLLALLFLFASMLRNCSNAIKYNKLRCCTCIIGIGKLVGESKS